MQKCYYVIDGTHLCIREDLQQSCRQQAVERQGVLEETWRILKVKEPLQNWGGGGTDIHSPTSGGPPPPQASGSQPSWMFEDSKAKEDSSKTGQEGTRPVWKVGRKGLLASLDNII